MIARITSNEKLVAQIDGEIRIIGVTCVYLYLDVQAKETY